MYDVFHLTGKIWKNHGYEILLFIIIVFISTVGVIKWNSEEKGTWTNVDDYQYLSGLDTYQLSIPPKQKRSNPFISKGETECKRVLEKLLKEPFNKLRPDWLMNPVTGHNKNLELDCYNERLKLACEYNGVQHYKFTPFFHKSKADFMNQKYRDNMKREKCKSKGIVLIEVPYTVKLENIERFIIDELKKTNHI